MQNSGYRQTDFTILRRSSGFTIVELLVVIVVIGILAAITIVSYSGVAQRANIATIQSDLANASKKIQMYKAQYDSYPTTMSGSFCPQSPQVDDSFCLKSSSGLVFSNYSSNGTTFTVYGKRNDVTYYVTESIPPTLADTYTKLLVHGDGTDGSTTIVDGSMNARSITAVGNAAISTAQKQFSTGGSIYMNDSSGYLQWANSDDFDFGTGDFTIDFWFRMTGAPASNAYSSFVSSRDNWNDLFVIYIGASNYGSGTLAGLGYNFQGTASGGAVLGTGEGSYTYALNTWYHAAFVREGANLKIYRDGNLVVTSNIGASTPIKFPSSDVQFGRHLFHAGNAGDYLQFRGYVDEIRISKGIARWTSNFSRPSIPYGN